MAKVFACFPGTGKTSFFKKHMDRKISDSDSSHFSWITVDGEKKRNPDFPANYIKHIKGLIKQEYEIIFVSTHQEVIQALKDAGIEFVVIAPNRDLKDVYLQRYKDRGSDEGFIGLLDRMWDSFLDDIQTCGVPLITLNSSNTYVEDGMMEWRNKN